MALDASIWSTVIVSADSGLLLARKIPDSNDDDIESV